MTSYLSSQALDALKHAHYAVNVSRLFLTRNELPEQVYREVKEVCMRLGGRWNTGSQAFLFAYDPTQALEIVQESGQMPPKNPYAFFPSPDPVSEDLLRYGFRLFGCNTCEGYRHGQPLHACQYLPPRLRILEPSAGDGAIARRVRELYTRLGREDYTLHCCELNPINREILRRQGFQVVAADFLDYQLKPGELPYDVVLMNPPFQGQTYIDHVMHAWEMTNPAEGTLTAVTSTSFTHYHDSRSRALHSLVCRSRVDTPTEYDAGRFKESGTSVRTMLLPLMKQDLSWRERPYDGYLDWHCAMLDFQIHQTKKLYRQYWNVWEEIEQGELAGDPTQPGWEHTRQRLCQIFTQAIDLARSDWIEICLNDDRLRYMERHFLAQGELECQCERHAALRQEGRGDFTFERVLTRSLAGQTEETVMCQASAPLKEGWASRAAILPPPEKCVQLPLFSA
jgi:hypothetical protein